MDFTVLINKDQIKHDVDLDIMVVIHMSLATLILPYSFYLLYSMFSNKKKQTWDENDKKENLKEGYNAAMWGVLMIMVWLTSCIAYHLLQILSHVDDWIPFIFNTIFSDIRFYLEYFIMT